METMNEAKNTVVYVINHETLEIEETNLYDWIMISAETTTSPRGWEMKLHVRENGEKFDVWSWGVRGNNPVFVETFDTEEEAEDHIFQLTWEFDFSKDDQRNTFFCQNYNEVLDDLAESITNMYDVDLPVAKSIAQHMQLAAKIKNQRQQAIKAAQDAEDERIENEACKYAAMVPVHSKNYKENEVNLAKAINRQTISKKIWKRTLAIMQTNSVK